MMRADEINAGSYNVYREVQVCRCHLVIGTAAVQVALVIMNVLLVLSAF